METIRKNRKVFFFVSMIILLFSLNAMVAFGFQGSGTGSYYDGRVYTGSYLRVGVNDYGALGVRDATLGDVGFQYPIGYDYESLAVGWWGDSWSVFYGDNNAGFSPDYDAQGTIEGVTPTVTRMTTLYGYLHTIKISTNDSA